MWGLGLGFGVLGVGGLGLLVCRVRSRDQGFRVQKNARTLKRVRMTTRCGISSRARDGHVAD